LVLARLPDAPDDVKGISLFIVPKFLKDRTRNAVQCIGLEHKLGIHGSPTCTMEFSGATGYLIGKENEGLKYMFTMMNNARLSVGLQGVAIAERSYQAALRYAQGRVQGKSFKTGQRVAIAEHADIKRMLLTMKSCVEAGRALTYEAALALDAEDAQQVDLLTPIVKSWCTDMACEVTSLGVQVHGGMGFIEETGAAQYYRDARILPIYEGTNGIQAADLTFRKILRDEGQTAKNYIAGLQNNISAEAGKILKPYFEQLIKTTDLLLQENAKKNMDGVAGIAASYLKAFGIIAGASLLARSASKVENISDKEFAENKTKTAQFFMHHILPQAQACLQSCELTINDY
jgi:hypothetical protein